MGRFLAALLAGLYCLPAFAFTQTLTSSGTPVHWDGSFKFNLAGNPVNSVGISAPDFRTAVVTGLQRWQTASGGTVSFDYWQGNDDSVYVPNSEFNGQSSIYFSSHSNSAAAAQSLTPGILGLTQVWYNTDNGKILEADTILNDRDFHFTMNPMDTSGFGSVNSKARGSAQVYIENVITHELGHSLGFAHSGGLQSTMLFMESPEEAHLGCDEQIGIHAMYPSADAGVRADISGEVRGPDGSPVFGAHVVAISRHRGTVLTSAMTNSNGTYTLRALEPGAYFLMAEPYYAGAVPLPAYYKGINPFICAGSKAFERTFLVDSPGSKTIPLLVSKGAHLSAPPIQVSCPSSTPRSSVLADTQIYNQAIDVGGFGIADGFSVMETRSYKLGHLSGNVQIRSLSYSLYSPAAFTMALFDSTGNSVDAVSDDESYVGDSGYINYDGSLKAENLPEDDYTLTLTPRSLPETLYPAGIVSLDSQPFVLVAGSVNEPEPVLSSTLPTNARCRMEENFATYVSPPGNPPRSSTDESDSTSSGCGTIQRISSGDSGDDSHGDSGNMPGPGAPAIIGWFLPWFAMGAMARLAKALARGTAQG